MDKNKIEEQIASLEASHAEEVQKLRDSLKPLRKARGGDVYNTGDPSYNLLRTDEGFAYLQDGNAIHTMVSSRKIEEDGTFIGKFHEVYFTKDQIEKMLLENLQTMEDKDGDEFKARDGIGWLDVCADEVEEFISNLVQNKNRDGSTKS